MRLPASVFLTLALALVLQGASASSNDGKSQVASRKSQVAGLALLCFPRAQSSLRIHIHDLFCPAGITLGNMFRQVAVKSDRWDEEIGGLKADIKGMKKRLMKLEEDAGM